MGMLDQPDDQKLNLGACLLRNAFRHWALAFSRRYMSGAPLPMLDGCLGAMPTFSDTLPPAGEDGNLWSSGHGMFKPAKRSEFALLVTLLNEE
jgi:hypothetical protein